MVPSVNPFDSRKQVSSNDVESLRDAAKSKAKQRSESTQSSSDQVDLSSVAKDIQTVRKHLGDISPDRLNRLNELAQKISKGEYQIDPKDVAQKMMEEFKKI